MKLRITTLIIVATALGFIIVNSFVNVGYTNPTGAPSARCGSIAHPLTCTDCHSGGSNAVMPGWITSTIPASGYVPGVTYTITATASYTGRSMFGFEITAENSSGTKKGTFVLTNTTTTKLVSTNTYVTHTSNGISGTSGYHTWTFNWIAPATGTGNVTFYGAFLAANGNTTESGDLTFKANLPVTEDVTTGITDNSPVSSVVGIYPNPVSDQFNVTYKVNHQGVVTFNLFDSQGQLVQQLASETKTPGEYTNIFKTPFNMNSGIYFLEIASETGHVVKRVLVQQ